MKRLKPARTQGQNEILVMHVLEQLSQGKFLKEIAFKYEIRLGTLTNMLKRYRERHSFKNMYHMLSIYVILREQKRKGASKAPFQHDKHLSIVSPTLPEANSVPLAGYSKADGHQAKL